MSESDNGHLWVTTDHGTIERFVSRRDAIPAAAHARDSDQAGELVIEPDGSTDELVELDWEEFFDRMDSRDAAVAVSYDDDQSTWSFDVVPNEAERTDEEMPASLATHLSSEETDDPSEAHHERATDEVNADNHRDEEPFQS